MIHLLLFCRRHHAGLVLLQWAFEGSSIRYLLVEILTVFDFEFLQT